MKKIKLTILFLLATPFLANSNTLLKSNESLIKSDEIVYIESTSIESIIADTYLSFEETKLPLSENQNNRAIGSAGLVWEIQTDTNYNNTFDGVNTNHYYEVPITSTTKLTGRVWNIPTTENFDIALYYRPNSTSSWTLVAFSIHPNATEEQLSFIAQPGLYLFEVADITEASTNSYSFFVSTSANYDSNEADDNFWQAHLQTQYETVTGTLDNNFDKDFITFDVTNNDIISFGISGGDYTAKLYFANGALAYTIQNNQIETLSLPSGSYFWEISSPSFSVNPSTVYTFFQNGRLSNLTLNFTSDQQTGYSLRIDWGQGFFFPIYHEAIVHGIVTDEFGNGIPSTKIRFEIISSVNSMANTISTVTTNLSGEYSVLVKSPVGLAANSYQGAVFIYHYDVHRMNINTVNDNDTLNNIPIITQIDDESETNNSNSFINLNDLANYTY